MIKHFSVILLIVLIIPIFILASCTTMKLLFPYNDVYYDSQDKALAAQKTDFELLLSKITPTKKPIGGSVVIILPSIAYIKNNFVVYKGSEISAEMQIHKVTTISIMRVYKDPEISAEMKENLFNFKTAKTFNELRYLFGEAIVKRKIFDKVVFLSSDDPENASFSEELSLVYFKKDGEGTWFLKRKGDITKMFHIESISAALPPVQMLNVWLDKVEKTARSE